MEKKALFKSELVNTVIGSETFFKGSLQTQRSIRIEGGFEGEINSQGEVYIGENSRVKANVFAKRIIIAGEITGNVEAIGGLHICKTGKVYGDITGDQLIIEEGAVYRGKVNMDIISSKNAYEGNLQLTRT
ncbi:MAG: polymer-forming cytoskeletal protein [bacterium]|nr:polymer-forming cytoskeletal protein [bacterium]